MISALALGLVIGAQHAFEPDHLAAVGTMLPEESTLRRAAARGALWGLGHGSAIAVVGLPLIMLGLRVPEHLEAAAEMLVALMLIVLGLHALWRAARIRREEDIALGSPVRTTLPVGLIHGLAGSGAAVLLATAQAVSETAALGFLLVFVIGSTLGMTVVAGFFSVSLGRLGHRPSLRPWIFATSGLLSVAVGVLWASPHVVGLLV
jgi:hypothetical protein